MDLGLIDKIEDLCSTEVSETRLYERAVDSVFEASERYNWVGIYKVEGEELVLGGWRGPEPTQHERIPLDKGICGFVATEGETIMVRDVNADSRYLACFINTKSEMVVPIKLDGEVIAEIDIDSNTPSAFEEDDKELLESVAARLGKKIGELRG
jgi:putative methionine-R-sulfoxide reductase with GAF domain